MRRTYSQSLEEDTGVVATFKKLKKSLFSRFGNTRRTQQHQQLHQQQQQQQQQQDTFNADISSSFKRSRNSSFQNNSQSQITAKQLEDYYNSLRRENELLTDNLKNSTNNNDKEMNSTSNNHWKDAESTNIVQDFNDQEINNINVNDDNDNDNDDNGIILLDEKNTDDNDFSINDMTFSGLLPLFSQPDPLERANLVQLKKMMELEKYRKYRLNYLREHTRHLKQSNLVKTGQHVKKPKHLKYPKKLDLKNLPSNRKNKSGTFGISLLNTVEDNEPEKDDLVRPINDNPVKKLKFPDAKENAIKFELPSKPRSFNAEEQKPARELEKHEYVKIETPATKSSISGTKLELKLESSKPAAENIDTSVDDRPTAAFNFGSLAKSSKLLFTSGKTDELKKGEPKPAFNFHNSPNKKAIILETLPDKDGLNDPKMDFISKVQSHNPPVESKTPSFPFDLKSKEPKTASDPKIPSLFDSKQPSNSLFSFGASKVSEKNPESKGKISFNPSESNVANDKKVNLESNDASTFSFGKPATSQNLTVPKLSFGLEKPTNQSTEVEPKPIFTFKTSTTQNEPEEKKIDKPTFSFGQTTSDKSSTTPAFSFSTSVNKPPVPNEQTEKTGDKEKPLFGNLADKPGKPKSVFNASAQPSSTDEKSKDVSNLDFASFGSAVDNKVEASAKSFGGFSSAAASNKQSMDIPKSTSDGFTFSGITSENKPNGISFAKTGIQENKTQNPSFNFSGSNRSASPSVFGSRDAISANKPVINFGGNDVVPSLDTSGPNANKTTVFESDTTKKSEPVFKFGEGTSSNELSSQDPKRKKMQDRSSGVGSSFQFGNSSLATEDTGSFSGLGNNLKTTNTNAKNNTVNNQSSSAFSFGGNTAKVNSTNVFNASSSSNPNNVPAKTGFGASNPASASGFSFGSGSTNSEFGQPNKNINNALAVTSGQTQTPGKIFSFNGNAFPSLDKTPKPNGFGGMASSNFNFGGNFNNNNNNISNNNNNNNSGFGVGSAFSGNNTMNSNSGEGVFGGNNNKGTGFNFGGSMPSSLTTSRASTPNFNFTGQSNLDPAAIFGASGSNSQMTQMGMNQAGMNQMGMNQMGMNQMGINQMGMNQAGMNQMGMNQNLPSNIQTRKKAQLRRSRRV